MELPELSVDLGEIEHPWLDELRRIAPTSPTGQKRILSIAHPVVYRLRVSTERGATWLDEDEVLWLCAVRRREDGSDDEPSNGSRSFTLPTGFSRPTTTISGTRQRRSSAFTAG